MVDPSPIHAVPLREHVYERLQEMLIARVLPPGGHLVEERLAGQLGVSRGPVREALQRLHRDGWVTLRPRYGAFVNQPTPDQVTEFFEARELLESWAASLAAQRCTDGDGAALLRICDEADEGLRTGRAAGEMAALTARFHTTVLEIARNHILLEFGRQLSHRSRWFFAPLVSSLAPRAWEEHRAVAELIGSGRADEAAAAMRTHISESRDAYLETQPVAPDGGADAAVPAAAVPAAAVPAAAVPDAAVPHAAVPDAAPVGAGRPAGDALPSRAAPT
ncbi:GntR family transcriptional regulator [Geodermatophilus sp. YIM 151500]|uniref:GntR family transcriptional regulator n=1 Tax=Geodermatophilus sp. YIM 151500 TaxID=2984531 RepID=UPI0021E3C969|nr:GntR family transcriptional regulator [Geodermatophilus sp. YIM 151500]MCV2488321.1 GntR family transcriptional regulator [Geodermatophilus sp. YIM 151500]